MTTLINLTRFSEAVSKLIPDMDLQLIQGTGFQADWYFVVANAHISSMVHRMGDSPVVHWNQYALYSQFIFTFAPDGKVLIVKNRKTHEETAAILKDHGFQVFPVWSY